MTKHHKKSSDMPHPDEPTDAKTKKKDSEDSSEELAAPDAPGSVKHLAWEFDQVNLRLQKLEEWAKWMTHVEKRRTTQMDAVYEAVTDNHSKGLQDGLVFERLYEELDEYKKDIPAQPIKRLMKDLFLLYDSVENHIAHAPTEGIRESLEALLDELKEIMYRNDVEVLSEFAEEPPPPETLQVVSTEEAQSAEQHNVVASVQRTGFVFRGEVLRPASVVLFKWKEA